MRTPEYEGKLTEALSRLYAERRFMSERGGELLDRPPVRESGIILPPGVREGEKATERLRVGREGQESRGRKAASPKPEAKRRIESEPPKRPKKIAEEESGLILPKDISTHTQRSRQRREIVSSSRERERAPAMARKLQAREASDSPAEQQRPGFILPSDLRRESDTPDSGEIREPKMEQRTNPDEERREFLDAHTREFMYRLFDSQNDSDLVLGMMLSELNEYSKFRSSREWTDEQRAIFYEEWREYSEFFEQENKKKEKEGLTHEGIERRNEIDGVLSGVRGELLKGVKDPATRGEIAYIHEDGESEFMKRKRRELVNADKIETPEIRQAFVGLLEQLSEGKVNNVAAIGKVRKQWAELEREYGDRLSDDPEARRAFEKIRVVFADANKQLFLTHQQEPVRLQARADAAEPPRPEPEPQPEPESEPEPQHQAETGQDALGNQDLVQKIRKMKGERASDAQVKANLVAMGYSPAELEPYFAVESPADRAARLARIGARKTPEQLLEESTAQYEQLQRRSSELREMVKNEPQAEAKADARKVWDEEKRHMAFLSDLKRTLRFDLDSDDSDMYGWSSSDKRRVIGSLGLDTQPGHDGKPSPAEVVLKAMLLGGMTGKEAVEFTDKQTPRKGSVQENVALRFLDDVDVWKAVGLSRERSDYLNSRFQQEPTSAQELAWQIGHSLPEMFGQDGMYPMLERRVRFVDSEGRRVDANGYYINSKGEFVDRKGNTLDAGKKIKAEQMRFETHERVRKDNFIMFFRERMENDIEYNNPHDAVNIFQTIELMGKQGYSKVNLEGMTRGKDKLFIGNDSEEVPEDILEEVEGRRGLEAGTLIKVKEDFRDTAEMLEREAMIAVNYRNSDIGIGSGQHLSNMEELSKFLGQFTERNPLTRGLWGGKPILELTTYMPGKFESLDRMDGEVGAAVIKNFLAYYNLSDWDELVKVLGEEKVAPNGDIYYDISKHPLFHLDGIREIRDRQVARNIKGYGEQDKDAYLNLRYKYDADGNITGYENKSIDDAFNIDGSIKNRGKLLDFINIFNQANKNGNIINIVKEGISLGIGRKEGLDPINSVYAGSLAFRMKHIFGASSKNDTSDVGKNAFFRLEETAKYRKKQAEDKERTGEDRDDPESLARGGKIGQKHTVAQYKALMENFVEGIYTTAWHGPEGAATSYRKTIYDVFRDLNETRRPLERMRKTEEEIRGLPPAQRREYEQQREMYQRLYQTTAANEMQFDTDAEVHWYQNQFERARKFYDKIMTDESLAEVMVKATRAYDPRVGYSFDGAMVHKEVLDFLTMVRYLYDTYGYTAYHRPTRVRDEQGGWKYGTVAERRFGLALVDIDEFKTNGKVDPLKIQQRKGDLRMQVFLVEVGAALREAREVTKYSMDRRFGIEEIDAVKEIMQKIPGDAVFDERDPRSTKILKGLIGKRRMKFFERFGNVGWFKLFLFEFLKQTFWNTRRQKGTEVFGGIGEGISRFWEQMFR